MLGRPNGGCSALAGLFGPSGQWRLRKPWKNRVKKRKRLVAAVRQVGLISYSSNLRITSTCSILISNAIARSQAN